MTKKDEVYPFNQADICGEDAAGSDAEAEKAYMNELYAGPEVFSGRLENEPLMNFVYASPQMSDDFEDDRSDADRDVPADDHVKVEDRKVSHCMYCGCGIQEDTRFCPNCGQEEKITIDPDDTILFCSNCRSLISPLSFYCPYCGTPTYRVRERERENITSVLYGPPVFTEKKGLVSKIGDLLKRK